MPVRTAGLAANGEALISIDPPACKPDPLFLNCQVAVLKLRHLVEDQGRCTCTVDVVEGRMGAHLTEC